MSFNPVYQNPYTSSTPNSQPPHSPSASSKEEKTATLAQQALTKQEAVKNGRTPDVKNGRPPEMKNGRYPTCQEMLQGYSNMCEELEDMIQHLSNKPESEQSGLKQKMEALQKHIMSLKHTLEHFMLASKEQTPKA